MASPPTTIVDVTAWQPPTPGSPADWRTTLGQIVVAVETRDGLRGLGVGGGGAAGIHVIVTVLRELLVGRDAEDVEGLHAAMCRETNFYGRQGLVVMALSGVDLALWDLRGRRAGEPVARLLNPEVAVGQAWPTYVTVFGADETEQALRAGHAAVKLHVERFGDRPDPAALRDLVAEARQRLGPDRMLMLDAFARWDVPTTLQVAEALLEFQLAWIEEPILPGDLAGYRELRDHCPIPVAGGEHEYLAEGFRPLIDERLHAVLQPDINWCGGMTSLVQIYRMAGAAGLRVCPHRGSEPFALPAIAALDPDPLAESPRRWFQVFSSAPRIEEGRVTLPAGPGFGVTCDPPQAGS